MKCRALHPWEVSPAEAQQIQLRLAPQVSRQWDGPREPRYVAGVDLSPPDQRGAVQGAAVVVELPGLEVVEVKRTEAEARFPYIPGLLSFRESPALLAALERLTVTPDLMLVDGQGLAHPRRFGLACHLGLLAGLPTIGCAKSILRGRHGPLGDAVGDWAELVDQGEVVGAAVRTRAGVNPIYASIGHRVDLSTAVKWVLACCRGYRMPEPTRLAHQAAAGHLAERGPGRDTTHAVQQARLL